MVRPLRSDHRRAKTSPRRAPLAAATSRNTERHHGPVAHWVRRSCSDGSSAIPMRFLTFGRSLWVTGFMVVSPHLIARTNAEDTKPAMFLTVFGFMARGVLDLRVRPPHFSNRAHSRLRWSG